ncbi:MAG: GreA/GreB family elongation factor [Pyrinomonadaceae bacterium]|nr:GreA/GreB family elongation factor [Pyrinomonadaceae bacterium]
MSRGFVKEGDQEEIPVLTPRAYLPDGVTNYVTQVGMDELLEEKQMLINERDQLDAANENERRIALNHINAKLQLLSDRILTAQIIDLDKQSPEEVWFGATVTLKEDNETELQQFQIVGVDEADVSKGKISFISPIAKILLGKKVGDEAVLRTPNGDRKFEIIGIDY